MSRVLYLEPLGGIAGNMFLGAAVDLGVALDAIEKPLRGLGVLGWRLMHRHEERHEIRGTFVDVELTQADAHPHRALAEIQALIRAASTLSPRVKERALAIFQCVGEAESKVHGVPISDIYFHEVGAVDSIVDICGASLVLELLGEPEVFCAPPPLGSGTVRGAHGVIPVPAPATVEILRNVPVLFEGTGELTTPTGAALVRALCRVERPPSLRIEKVGYGVGSKDFADRPNVLRAFLGERVEQVSSSLFQLEVNFDDCSPQWLGHLIERVISAGALDAFVAPVTMKKSRPGHWLGVIVPSSAKEAVLNVLLAESTTLGVRFFPIERVELERTFETVQTQWGPVRIKVGRRGKEALNAAPEFEDCRSLAEKAGVPLKQVWLAALAAHFNA